MLTGRHGLLNCYEAFIHIVDSMFNQHAKWLKTSREVEWRRPIASRPRCAIGAGPALPNVSSPNFDPAPAGFFGASGRVNHFRYPRARAREGRRADSRSVFIF